MTPAFGRRRASGSGIGSSRLDPRCPLSSRPNPHSLSPYPRLPSYNTGNEKWAYSDAVNSPEMREWLGRVVGAEAEDLSRHDKWLCMMYPRLQLLRQFLRDDGAIFIRIDDKELHSLRLLLDEIFGPRNFVATVIWQKVYVPKNSAKHFSQTMTTLLSTPRLPQADNRT